MGEGSLHPQPEGRGIRDPPRSRCNNFISYVKLKMGVMTLFGFEFTPIDLDTSIPTSIALLPVYR